MNNSTQDVTLLTGFVFDVLAEYENVRKTCAPAFAMAAGLDAARPDQWCSIDIYNGICDWIEQNVGASSIRTAGAAIGERIFANIVANGKMVNPEPLAVMQALTWAASNMIRDPQKRGWEIVDHGERRIIMRRTQTFNCALQDGLLLALVERTGVLMPSVDHVKCTRRHDEFCEYEIRWLKNAKAK